MLQHLSKRHSNDLTVIRFLYHRVVSFVKAVYASVTFPFTEQRAEVCVVCGVGGVEEFSYTFIGIPIV